MAEVPMEPSDNPFTDESEALEAESTTPSTGHDPAKTLAVLTTEIQDFIKVHENNIKDHKAEIREHNKAIKDEEALIKEKKTEFSGMIADLQDLLGHFEGDDGEKKKETPKKSTTKKNTKKK